MLDEKEENKKILSNKYEFIFSLLAFVLLVLIIIFIGGEQNILIRTCGDDSPYGSCSITRPYYCDSGILVEKASVCGCGGNSEINGDSCLTSLQTEPKQISLTYRLDGEDKNLNFTVYGGLTNYLANESRVISYSDGQEPARVDFELKILDNERQRELLLPLVITIQNLTNNKADQARIATSLVQNIPYGFSNKTQFFFGQEINYSRYPYEVLYDLQGICGEKSELLAFLLRETGYGTVIFYNQQENHEAVGIKCPRGEGYMGTGYCFIETTAPAIISDDEILYVGDIFLESEPEVIEISQGRSLPYSLPEYRDAEVMKYIRQGKFILFKEFELNRLRDKYGLVEEYNIA